MRARVHRAARPPPVVADKSLVFLELTREDVDGPRTRSLRACLRASPISPWTIGTIVRRLVSEGDIFDSHGEVARDRTR